MRGNRWRLAGSLRRLLVGSDPFDLLAEVAATLNPDGWVLVGGLMVHCHGRRAGVTHVRPTDDADIVVELLLPARRLSRTRRGDQHVKELRVTLEPLEILDPILNVFNSLNN